MPTEINSALLLAAGSGTRMQGTVDDKILARLKGKPAFSYSLEAFADCEAITHICVVYRDEAQRKELEAITSVRNKTIVLWTAGGPERQDSVLHGLKALPEETAQVLIHDCARPLVSVSSIYELIGTARLDGAACLAQPVKDTVKRIPIAGETRQTELEDLDRNRLWAMETPQAFRYGVILKAYEQIHREGVAITDDSAAAAHTGIRTTLVPNMSPNPKITTAADLDYIEWLLSR